MTEQGELFPIETSVSQSLDFNPEDLSNTFIHGMDTALEWKIHNMLMIIAEDVASQVPVESSV